MKKLFFAVLFSIALISNTVAASNVNNVEVLNHGCFDAADIGAGVLGALYDLSYEQEANVFNMLYDACLEQNQ